MFLDSLDEMSVPQNWSRAYSVRIYLNDFGHALPEGQSDLIFIVVYAVDRFHLPYFGEFTFTQHNFAAALYDILVRDFGRTSSTSSMTTGQFLESFRCRIHDASQCSFEPGKRVYNLALRFGFPVNTYRRIFARNTNSFISVRHTRSLLEFDLPEPL